MLRPAVLAVSATLLLGSSRSTSPSNIHPAPVPIASKPHKNVQILKDVAAPDWIPTMEFISGSLGVSCEFCHTIGKFESDSKAPKRRAREMISMASGINREYFGGKPVVTCNSCHHGQIRPNAVPSVWNKSNDQLAAYLHALSIVDRNEPASAAAAPAPASSPVASYPSASQVLARYRRAVGARAMNSWKSLRVAGSATAQAAHGVVKFAVSFVLPDKMVIGDSVPRAGAQPPLVVSGDRAWAVTPQGHTMLPAEQTETVAARARLFAPVKIVESPSMRTIGLEKVGHRSFIVVEWRVPKVVTRAYFDSVSGLLSKTREETDTPLGTMVNETLFEDYRNLDGVKLPYRIIGLFMEDRIEYTVTDAQKNPFVDPTLFVAPRQ
jgi:photosynthetic reaction center cytochrome c subunit